MRSNKKLARALAGVMIGSQVLTTVPIANVVPVFASEVNMNESTTSSKSVESTLIANAEDLGGDVVVTIPNKMTLALNSETKTLGASSEVYAKGICGVLDSLTVSVTSDKINFVNKNKATDTVEADVNFGTDNTAKWTADQLIDGLNDELTLVKQPIKLETNKSKLKYAGEYQADVSFNINIESEANTNKWQTKGSTLFNYSNIDNTDNVMITGLTDSGAEYLSEKEGEMLIPEKIEGKQVTKIDYNAFKGNNNIKKVALQEGLEEIDGGAFYNCASLTDINIPASLTSTPAINTGKAYYTVFGRTNLSNVILNEGITKIPNNIFEGCRNITKIKLPESVEEIGSSALASTGITSINLNNTVKKIGHFALQDCASLSSVDGLNNLEEIGNDAFSRCTSLDNINLNNCNKLTTLGDRVFEGDTNLKKADLCYNASISKIGVNLFMDCTSLVNAYNCIPNKMNKIPQGMFRNCTSLGGLLELPSNIKTIESDAFNGSGLEMIKITSDIIIDGMYTFANSGLEHFMINTSYNGVRTDPCILLLQNCKSLTTITIPKTFKLYTNDIVGCTLLSKINYGGTQEQWEALGFTKPSDLTQTITVHCTDGDITL